MKKRWGKIAEGDRIEIGGREWVVESAKAKKGGRVKVAVRSGSRRAESVVEADEKVKIATPEAPSKKSKPAPRKPPKPAHGDPWETQQDRIEKKLDSILGARLIGEATDTDAGYYVPEVDVTTVAAHLAIFHGGIPEWATDEGQMVEAHARDHVRALDGAAELAVNHWHTERRPTSKKGKR